MMKKVAINVPKAVIQSCVLLILERLVATESESIWRDKNMGQPQVDS